MFENPSLNNIFDNYYDGFYIFSNQSEIEILLKELANYLSYKYKILYISNDDTLNLNDNIFYCNIFNEKALKNIYKINFFDYIFVENISFFNNFYKFPKNSKIIACGFLRSDLRYFLNIKTRIIKFGFNDDFLILKAKNCKFKYNFNVKTIKTNRLFRQNKIDFDLDKEINFYFSCLEQNFKFITNRNSRFNELLEIFDNGNLIYNNIKFIKTNTKGYFYINDKKINRSFIPSGLTIYNKNIKIVENKMIKEQNIILNLFKKLKHILIVYIKYIKQ
ncbi:hypothetical protein [Campylobacter sp. MG1]|uniref:hypothetical protein n=1 Tax=Campylobacter sp. MG1 TaxID=2976332 RepID=UPI00226D2CA4|nr:hypothetical protein [Campylobacter sp. MG1]